ncbi:MAG: hypothetical protein IKM30_08350 [Oscillospiraceae bacterium]|nr:hypothetical protein [Oscillospiraceae bacterium]
MKKHRIFRFFTAMTACIAILLLLNLPAYLKIRSGKIASMESDDYFAFRSTDVVEGEIRYALGCALEKHNGIWSTHLTSDESDKRYYVLWQPSGHMILYATTLPEEYPILDQLVKETLAYADSVKVYQQSGDYEDLKPPVTTLRIQGEVKMLYTSLEDSFRIWYEENVGESFETQCAAVYLSRTGFTRYGICSKIGVVLAFCSLLLGFASFRLKRRAQSSVKQIPQQNKGS